LVDITHLADITHLVDITPTVEFTHLVELTLTVEFAPAFIYTYIDDNHITFYMTCEDFLSILNVQQSKNSSFISFNCELA